MAIRVLIVDDSAFFRQLLSDLLAAEQGIEVVGTARNGRDALDRIDQLKPHVVTLDVEMPELDGLSTLSELRRRHPRLPVIMFSALTERAAAMTVDALLRGANDYVTKPTNGESAERIRLELAPKIRQTGAVYLARCSPNLRPGETPAPLEAPRPQTSAAPAPEPQRIHVAGRRLPRAVVLGLSTGGPKALTEIFTALPPALPAPILIVQHMLPMFTRVLAERLSGSSKHLVREAVEGVALQAGQVWIAPGDSHLEVVEEHGGARLHLTHDRPENNCRPAVDVLFRSAARVFGPGLLAVVMTGMGRDGCLGAKAVREAGGAVWAQDEASSVVWGMPGQVVEQGIAERVLPLAQIGPEIARALGVQPGAPMARPAAEAR